MRKVRPLLDLIRGQYADDALDILKYMPHRGARLIEQVLKSAMANAEDKGVRNVGELVVSRRPRRRRPDVQAADAPGPGHGLPDPPPHRATSRSAWPTWRSLTPSRSGPRTERVTGAEPPRCGPSGAIATRTIEVSD